MLIVLYFHMNDGKFRFKRTATSYSEAWTMIANWLGMDPYAPDDYLEHIFGSGVYHIHQKMNKKVESYVYTPCLS